MSAINARPTIRVTSVIRTLLLSISVLVLTFGVSNAQAQVCEGFGPQTPRDITDKAGTNKVDFSLAPTYKEMNLCNIHFHKNAEHKGPRFSTFAGEGRFGGYQCNETSELSERELKPPKENLCKNVAPGDTIEVHWVYSSCDVGPGIDGLGDCSSASCANPQLRVETQVFLLVRDPDALSFADFDYAGPPKSGFHQAKALPTRTGAPVVFRGSTTGPDFTEQVCSPLQVTWSVRPACAKLGIHSLSAWCGTNVFKERKAHGVRQLVTNPALLSKID